MFAGLIAAGLSMDDARAQGAPDSVSFQGFVTDPSGTPLDTTVGMTFKLYKDATAVWEEEQPAVVVTDGVLNVLLGSVTPLDGVAFNQSIDLGIKVGADPEINPRTPLASAPFALGMRGMHAVWTVEGTSESLNVIGGAPNNSVGAGVVGATISGGGGISSGSAVPNTVTGNGHWATVGGGRSNTASVARATVGGGRSNTASAQEATVGGGAENTASGLRATVGGGDENTASLNSATVGGGRRNTASGQETTVGGGSENTANGLQAAVGGGKLNTASLNSATVGGGFSNTASGAQATVGGGNSNTAGGSYATVPGGEENRAAGVASFAAGHDAKAIHDGTFVWNDRSIIVDNDSLVSTGPNQFLIRAAGGVGIGTNAPITRFHVVRSANSVANAENHVALIDNSSTGTSADVLALRIARTTNPESTNVFASFLYSGTAAGHIRGNGSGGVELFSSGSDYAELLERTERSEVMEPGDVVSVVSGKISLRSRRADRFMVISDQAIVVGNMPDPSSEHLYERVAFVGQVPVKVIGPVRAGDFLVPSDREDGSAVAIARDAVRSADLSRIAAVAWESSDDPGLKKVVAEVGLDRGAAVQTALENEMAELRALVTSQREQLAQLEARLTQ